MNELNETDGQLPKLYEFFFESHPTPIYVWKYFEDEFILIKYNNAADILTKGKMKDFLGIKSSELYKDRPDIFEDLYRCKRNQNSFSKELKYYYQTLNEEKILYVNYFFIQPELVLVHIEDITDRKKAQEKLKEDEQILKESEENFRNIAEQSFIGIEILQDGKIKYVNDAVSKILEYSIQEMKEWKFTELFTFIHPDDLHIAQELWKKRQEEGGKKVISYSLRAITKSGIIKMLEIISKIVHYQGKPAIFVVINDVTDTKKAEQKLKESEKNYRNLVNNINDILIEVDANRNISYISPQAYDILGYQPEEIIGMNSRDLLHPNE